jgi:tetratricopeptide (TPR) repeat protein
MDKTFGQAFGALIREKRGQEGLTQRQLAIKAFDDESKLRRIIDLENGLVSRPQIKTIDPLIAYFNITRDEIEQCRSKGLFSSNEQSEIGLSRLLMENLSTRFEHDNPDAPDDELIAHLKGKAEELKLLKRRLSEIEGSTSALNNQIRSANEALESGRFDEADEILAAAEELQQENRTLKEIGTQSDIRFARGDAALFRGEAKRAFEHYVRAASYFTSFAVEEAARRYERAAGQIYEVERRRRTPDLEYAVQLSTRALDLTPERGHSAAWVMRKYHLALVQQTAARISKGSILLYDAAIENAREAIKFAGDDLHASDLADCMVVLGNSHLGRSQVNENKNWKADVQAAISVFEEVVRTPRFEKLRLVRSYLYNNISSAYRNLSRRSGEAVGGDISKKSKDAVLRAIEWSTREGQIDVWAAAQHNLGGILAEEAADTKGPGALFLRIQSISAFGASLEVFPHTAFSLQMAETQLAMGRVLLDHAGHSAPELREAYLMRSIAASEVAADIFGKDSNPSKWSETQFHIGLAFFLHAEIAETEIEFGDLERALSYFHEAEAGYRSPGQEKDFRKLRRAQKATKARLKALRAAATQTP